MKLAEKQDSPAKNGSTIKSHMKVVKIEEEGKKLQRHSIPGVTTHATPTRLPPNLNFWEHALVIFACASQVE
jgi:hypothetical protein